MTTKDKQSGKRATLTLKKKEKKPSNQKKNTEAEAEFADFTVLLKAETGKISPKANGKIGYAIVKDKDNALYVQLLSNSSSGNFCKTPVRLQDVIDILGKQESGKAFNSKVMLGVFQGKGSRNSNNTSFLMAILRSKAIKLTKANPEKPLSSLLSDDFEKQAKQLLAMS